MNAAPDWQRDGRHWPNRDASLFVEAAGLRWHLQRMGQGPVLLLLHGTGAASHSWRDLMPLLAADFTVLAPDLPGHGFSGLLPPAERTLPGMARGVSALLRAMGLVPMFAAGHSAGAALSAQLAASGPGTALRRLVWLCGALTPFDGLTGVVAPALAGLLSRSRWLPGWVARHASDAAVRHLIDSTGSTLDAHGIAAYRSLLRSPAHVRGALAMMAGWDLAALQPALARLHQPVLLLHGDEDRTVPPRQSEVLAGRLARARLRRLPGLGHLAHEQQPARVAGLIRDWCLDGADLPAETRD